MEIKISLIGYGNVGKSLIQLLNEKKAIFNQKFDLMTKVVAIFEYDGALINNDGIDLEELIKKGKDFRALKIWQKDKKAIDFINESDFDVCIETTPTNPETGEPALNHIITALKRGIHVIASNKGPFYLKYKQLKEIAETNKTSLMYEATVASCVPTLSVKKNLLGVDIRSIKAILNGTSNYILSRMASEGVSFSNALTEAQELGYAEADPTLDIEGYDAAGKIVILANELLGWEKQIKDVKVTGITKITPQALQLAKMDGYMIKHLAIAENNSLIVEPRLIEIHSPLNISGTLNVIELSTKNAGPIILMGRGAGGNEAATAILNDLITLVLTQYSKN